MRVRGRPLDTRGVRGGGGIVFRKKTFVREVGTKKCLLYKV